MQNILNKITESNIAKYLIKLYEKYGGHFLSLVFIFGFIVDVYTLPSITNKTYPFIGLIYIFIVATFLVLRDLYSRNTSSEKLYKLSDIAVSFFQGSVLSYVFIYYLRSGDLYTSWPVIVFLFIAMIVNEIHTSKAVQMLMDYGLFFLGFIFYIIYNAPVYFKRVDTDVFIKSILISFVFIITFIIIYYIFIKNKKFILKMFLLATVVFTIIPALYFSGIMPAVPITLRDVNVYNYVGKLGNGEYDFLEIDSQSVKINKVFVDGGMLSNLESVIYNFLIKLNLKSEIIYIDRGKTIYFYAAVVAPSAVNSKINHVWQVYDNKNKKWVEDFRISYPAVGGREGGYRGYSLRENIYTGYWRVLVEVEDRVVGQKRFEIKYNQ